MDNTDFDKLPHVWGAPDSIEFRNRRRFPAAYLGNGSLLITKKGENQYQIEHRAPKLSPPAPDNLIDLNKAQAQALYRWLGKVCFEETDSPGYHLRTIPRGTYGKVSKIQEEVAELEDAEEQGVRVMVLCELADLVGSIQGYLKTEFPNFTMEDLLSMAQVTARAFKQGER